MFFLTIMTKENRIPNSGSISKSDYNSKKRRLIPNRDVNNRLDLFTNFPKTPEVVKKKIECPPAPRATRSSINIVIVPAPFIPFPDMELIPLNPIVDMGLPTTPITVRRRIECPDAPKKKFRHF